MKLPRITSSKKSPESISVPVELQRAVIFVLLLMQAINVVFLVFTYGFNSSTFSWNYAAGMIAMQLMPLVIFGVAYYGMASFKTMINRTFMALLYSIVAVSLIYGLQSMKSYVSILLVGRDGNSYDAPPAWLTSFTIDYIVIGVGIVLFAAYMYNYRKSH